MAKNVLEARKLFFSTAQLPSGPQAVLSFLLNERYQAKPNVAIAKQIKKGRAGSNQDKDEAAPLAPARSANSGVMQHNDAAIAAMMPTPVTAFDVVSCFTLFAFYG